MLRERMFVSVERGRSMGPLRIRGLVQRRSESSIFGAVVGAGNRFYERRRSVSYRIGCVEILRETDPSVASFRHLGLDHMGVSFRLQILVPHWIAKRLSRGIPFWSFRFGFGASV